MPEREHSGGARDLVVFFCVSVSRAVSEYAGVVLGRTGRN